LTVMEKKLHTSEKNYQTIREKKYTLVDKIKLNRIISDRTSCVKRSKNEECDNKHGGGTTMVWSV
jgi:hypothetical protein